MKEYIHYSIVIPVYNSTSTLTTLNTKIKECMTEIGKTFEILFVEDCGQDNSWEVLKKIKASSSHMIRCFRLANNFGQWAALLCGLEQANGEYVITIDDDLQYNERDIIKLCKYIEEKDLLLVYGIPNNLFEDNLKQRQRRARNFWVNFIFSKEITSSFRVFKRNIFINNNGKLRSQFHFEAAEKLFIAPKYKDRIPVDFRARTKGRSGYSLLKKVKLIWVYGIEYYSATVITLLITGSTTIFFSIFLFVLFIIRRSNVFHDASYHLLTALIFNLGVTLVAIGILSLFLSRLFLMQKGKPIYIIAESI